MSDQMGFTASNQRDMSQEWICADCLEKVTAINNLPKIKLFINTECCICNSKLCIGNTSIHMDDIVNLFRKREYNFSYKYEHASDGFSLEKVVHDSFLFKKCNDGCSAEIFDINTGCPHKNIFEKIGFALDNAEINFFSKNFHYKYRHHKNNGDLEKKWSQIAKSIMHENRYFNTKARNYFDNIFDAAFDIGIFKVLTKIKPKKFLYRGRSYKNHEEKKKILRKINREMYAPIPHLSSNNRMSPSGVSLLYLGDSIETCRKEIGYSKRAVFVKLIFQKPLQFFDFTKFNNHFFENFPIEVYDIGYRDIMKSRYFLQNFINEKISNPIKNDIDYVMTQALCNYIEVHVKMVGVKIDGVIYNSVKNAKGKTYAIFSPHKSKVKKNFKLQLFRARAFSSK